MRKSRVSRKKEEDEVEKQILHDRESNMFFIFREMCFIFAILFTAYASVLNTQSKTKKTASPVPFFWPESVVEDFYRGDLHLLMKEISETRLAFVMFYAPWDSESKEIRDVFEEVAQFYEPDVYFAGVNCWQPGSECKATFKNIPRFPQLVAYMGSKTAVEYRGPYQANHMIKFIDSLLHPLVRVNTKSELWKLRFQYEAVLVGCLKMRSLEDRMYDLLYLTAWKMAGRDYSRRIAFAVITHDKINPSLGVTSTPTFLLYLWNKEIKYEGELKRELLMQWLFAETSKSQLISRHLALDTRLENPLVVALFYKHHPLHRYPSSDFTLRKAAMRFYGCSDYFNETSDKEFYNHLFGSNNAYSLYEQDMINSIRLERRECMKTKRIIKIRTCTTNVIWSNQTCFQQTCPSSRRRDKADEAEDYYEWFRRTKCELLEREKREEGRLPAHSPSTSVSFLNACQVNSSVVFALLDTDSYPQLARMLGISSSPELFLFNSQEVMKINERITDDGLLRILSLFISGKIVRHMRDGETAVLPDKDRQTVSISELQASSFMPVVFNNSQTVVVLYYSKYCGTCGMLSQTLLRLAHSWQHLTSVKIFRINGETNDLPFYLQVHSYPTVIIFPANRKSESRVFPSKKAWTLTNLTQFILSNLEPKQRIIAMLAACSKWSNNPSYSKDGDSCIREVRVETVDLISSTLREWRLRAILGKRRKLMETLNFLKQTYLRLARVTDIKALVGHLLSLG